ncbi:hypothetical protein WJX72_003946 [[Myrmecia] bisecta]|uniref:GDP-mannose 4,6-dehydratase n=1 Tax=[Myrmecia] bisecta TaxID=41462 RepID=A0AAW1QAI9_9CHLO
MPGMGASTASKRKSALITGVSGQDGSYLAELLLEEGYEVHGMVRRSSSGQLPRIDHLRQKDHPHFDRFHLHFGDMTDHSSMCSVLRACQPDEVYNLAAQSHVQVSFEMPQYTADASGVGVLALLEAVRSTGMADRVRFYQASTSELYGKVHEVPQNEETPFHPRSPYAVAKLYGYWAVRNYREAYNMYACNGILFNHESPRRGEMFVTRKITISAARIAEGLQDCLFLGNLDAQRDWGHARDYVKCMYLMLQQEKADDYVIASGKTTTVRTFATLAFKAAGIALRFEGKDVEEVGIAENGPLKGKVVLAVDPQFYRPAEVDLLLGDPSKATRELGWHPTTHTNMEDLCAEMVAADLQAARAEKRVLQARHNPGKAAPGRETARNTIPAKRAEPGPTDPASVADLVCLSAKRSVTTAEPALLAATREQVIKSS